MINHVNPKMVNDLKKYGKGNWNACFHCGNCTAVCSLTEQGSLFPRKEIRIMQIGLKSKLASSIEPWLCYYCGDCSEKCLRDANPGELMMAVRRYLTKIYDWTGLSGLFYSSLPALIIAFILVAAAIIGIGYMNQFNIQPIMEFGHYFEKIAILSVAGLILFPNIIRMFWFTIVKEKIKPPIYIYIKGFWKLVLHMFTQKNTLKCDNITLRWFEHFLIVIGYIVLLVTTVFLNWFTTENTFIIWMGYVVGGIIFIFTFDFILNRIRKKKEVTRFSHITDWIFVVWLFLLALSAFSVRICIDTKIISTNQWLYMVHLIILAQWAVLIVPFGKWTHFLYRSFAIYFNELKMAALKRQGKLVIT